MSPTIPAALMLALSGVVGLACTSDDLLAATEAESSTTFIDPTEVVVFTTGEAENTTTTGEVPSEVGCEEAVSCIVNCAINLPVNPPPEQDFSCFFPCVDGMNTEEWLALIEVGTCVYDFCTATAKCPDIDDEMTCTACLITSIVQDPGVMGCEAQSLACE